MTDRELALASVRPERRGPWAASWMGGLLGLVFALLTLSSSALAEPRFSATSGLRCGRCHVSPTGGGKRSAYGTLFAMTELRLLVGPRPTGLPPRGEQEEGPWLSAGVATGEVTPWLAVGADLRLTHRTTFGDTVENTFDTSRGQLYLEVRPWPERLTLYVDAEVGGEGIRLREGWAMGLLPLSLYLRAGRLLPPFGLRLFDDAAYSRLVTGATFSNPDLGLEAGLDLGWLMAAVALTNGSFSGQDQDSLKALWGLVEASLGPARLGLSAAYNPSEEGCRAMGALFGAVGLGRLVLQAEADIVAQRPATSERWAYQMVGLIEAHVRLVRGLEVMAGFEIHDADLELGQDLRERVRVGLAIFPFRMVQARVGYVFKQAQTSQAADWADLLEVMLHVYL